MEGDAGRTKYNAAPPISIHALRVEGDTGTLVVYDRVKTISIHALRVEGDCFTNCARSAWM